MKRHIAILGLISAVVSIVSLIWGLSASWAELEAKVNAKANIEDVRTVHNKLDIIICYLDKSKCL